MLPLYYCLPRRRKDKALLFQAGLQLGLYISRSCSLISILIHFIFALCISAVLFSPLTVQGELAHCCPEFCLSAFAGCSESLCFRIYFLSANNDFNFFLLWAFRSRITIFDHSSDLVYKAEVLGLTAAGLIHVSFCSC